MRYWRSLLDRGGRVLRCRGGDLRSSGWSARRVVGDMAAAEDLGCGLVDEGAHVRTRELLERKGRCLMQVDRELRAAISLERRVHEE